MAIHSKHSCRKIPTTIFRAVQSPLMICGYPLPLLEYRHQSTADYGTVMYSFEDSPRRSTVKRIRKIHIILTLRKMSFLPSGEEPISACVNHYWCFSITCTVSIQDMYIRKLMQYRRLYIYGVDRFSRYLAMLIGCESSEIRLEAICKSSYQSRW